MATVLKRQESRRRLAAITFLSNISLDGTHRDTKLAIFVNVNRESIGDHPEEHNQDKQLPSSSKCNPPASTSFKREKKTSTCEQNGRNCQSSPKSRRQSCSLPLGQPPSTKDAKQSSENLGESATNPPEERARLSSIGSYKRKGQNIPPSSVTSQGHITVPSGIQPLIKSRNSSINRGSEIASFGKPINVHLANNETKQQVHFLRSPREFSVQSEKYVFVTAKKTPLAMLSYIPFSKKAIHATNRDLKQDPFNKRRHASGTRQLSTIADGSNPLDLLSLLGFEKPVDGQDISFSYLLNPTFRPGPSKKSKPHSTEHNSVGRCVSYDSGVTNPKSQVTGGPYLMHQTTAPSVLSESESIQMRDKHPYYSGYSHMYLKYNPNILDDPELIAGKHSTLLDFPSYLTSIINYVKPSDLKKELNEKFKERFPCVQLTLSKMRSLKRDMCKILKHEGNVDYLTVAQAYVYFEKLILKLLINKQNRKLCAGACLLLSAKLNDVKGPDLKRLIERIESVFRIDRKDLFAIEFSVLVALEFGLHLPVNEILSHYQRLMYET